MHRARKLLNLIQENLAEENKQISRQRIFIEHLIRRLKIFRIAADKFRLNPPNYETVILIICGLVRLRLGTFSFSP
ncbi:MAG: transposase family protein [Pleurocapsa sp. MO_226.B13]|nr:transposase family protein [Pleurocapsa sp. MO_226.B13]